MKKFLLFIPALGAVIMSNAQMPAGGAGRRGGQNMNMGHFYGKVVDSKNKGIDAASVQLVGSKYDTATKTVKENIFATVITKPKGDFSLENLPVFGKFTLKISNIGFLPYEKPVSFDVKMPSKDAAAAGGDPQDRMQQMIGMIDKDLGNIKLVNDTTASLASVTVTATKPFFEMGVDRKIFNVDKNIVSSGQTATEVMKQIPSLNVDIDGNVTLRNASPQLFIDGRPTTLTMDQIPADLIDKVELITNPSAKFDASGGGGGIINIVLKKNNRKGYNGGIRGGVDSRGKYNLGGDFNFRSGKINFFLSGAYNQRLTKYTQTTDRNNIDKINSSNIHLDDKGQNEGHFAFIRGGFDYFLDNRNTITVGMNYFRGSFHTTDNQVTDSTINSVLESYTTRLTDARFQFRNYNPTLSFKHNFSKNGHDVTADINYNSSSNNNTGFYPSGTYDYATNNLKYIPVLQQTLGSGTSKNVTIQADYENPITENAKLEAGVRAALRNNNNANYQYFDSSGVGNNYQLNQGISSNYKYDDKVYAAYANYSLKTKKFNYQFGLRVESSDYNGTKTDIKTNADSSFHVKYPVSLFPSAFITYKLKDFGEDIQLNYSRRINRPNFQQLLPFIDYTDPQNLRVGNPGLKPEFTNAFEISYDKSYAHGGNFLVTGYFKYTTDLITGFQNLIQSPLKPADSVPIYSYRNANSSITYGLEITNKVTVAKIWDLTLNLNLYDSKINASNLQSDLTNERVSWFAKMNNNFKLPKGFSIQFSGNYQAKTVLPQNSGGGGRGGGGNFFGGGNLGTAQGYVDPFYSFDAAVKKDFTWKGGNSASISLSMNDIFRTGYYKTYSTSQLSATQSFSQYTDKLRDPQILRLNFSYRFGKLDATLFKRKNTKQTGDQIDMGNN